MPHSTNNAVLVRPLVIVGAYTGKLLARRGLSTADVRSKFSKLAESILRWCDQNLLEAAHSAEITRILIRKEN